MEVAAVGWGISIAGWIISPYITRLLDKAYSHIKPGKPREDLKNLVIHVIPQLALTLQAAKGGAHKKELEGLVKELKSAFDDTEDILDELQYNSLDIQNKQRRSDLKERDEAGPSNQETRKNDASQKGATKEKLERSTRRHTSVICHLKNKLSMCRNPDPVYIPQLSQGIVVDHIPKDIRDRLVKNVKNIEELIDKARTTLEIGNAAHVAIGSSNLGSGNRSAEQEENATAKNTDKTSAYATLSVTGRDEVRKQIIEKLHTEDVNPSSSDSTCLSAIGIWGIPGSGKTTLAKYIFDSEENGKYFDPVMLIHVSKSFSVHGILKEMLEQAFEGDNSCPNYTSRVVLIKELKKLLTEKRILLVLDDIWFTENVHNERLKFAEIISPLMVGKRGSKVLVTSRHRNGVKLLGPGVKVIDNSPIPELDDKVFLELFMHHAFGQKIRNKTLMKIGREIAQKLKKSPLLAATVGGILFMMEEQDVDRWLRVRDQELLDNDDYMGPLWWCYQHLNEQAKRCFAYCSVFPRKRRLYRDELVNLWVAEGFISSTGIGSKMESVGRDCFNELLSVSFLKPGGKDLDGKEYFIIHDLLYDTAEMVAGSDCFKIEDGMTKAPSDVRHLSIESCNASMITEDIIKLRNLRTLIIFNAEDDMSEQVYDKMFRKLTKLRVLIFQARIKDDKISSFSFPESIAYLRYLRYLGFQVSWVMSKRLSKIRSFQIGLGPKVRLPAKLAKLYLLQVLDLGRSKKFDFSAVEDMANLTNLRHLMYYGKVGFRNIGRLTSLQTIPPLRVSSEKGYGLEQLGNLNKLRGKLDIRGLGSVKSKEEALAAKLADKERLTELVLDWYHGSTPDVQADVHQDDVQADVLEGLCPPEGLQYMKLFRYEGSRHPSWMVGPRKSTMQLQELELCMCRNKLPKTINMEHLKSLTFEFLVWDDLPDDMSLLTSLKRLIIRGCYNIRRLPALPTSLEYFELWFCSEEFSRSCTTEGNQNWEEIKNIPNIYIEVHLFGDSYIRGEGRGGYQWRNL